MLHNKEEREMDIYVMNDLKSKLKDNCIGNRYYAIRQVLELKNHCDYLREKNHYGYSIRNNHFVISGNS